jgi:hypothetical protein
MINPVRASIKLIRFFILLILSSDVDLLAHLTLKVCRLIELMQDSKLFGLLPKLKVLPAFQFSSPFKSGILVEVPN